MNLNRAEERLIDEIVDKITHVLDTEDAASIAGALTVLGLRIYKTVLNDAEYADIQKHILKRSDTLTPFTERKLH
tara:strand:- start:268 stop:492 length:225 start_codon:yes stop_codon:yes gene_type:complete